MHKIEFTKPDISETDIEAVCNVLRSGWITTGPVTKEFEQEIAAFCHTERAACLNSQTMAAELVLRLFGIGPGDEVIIPAYTYTASCSIIYHVGATPVMIDSQTDSPEMDYDLMEKAINSKTKAIIPVDLGGVICDYERIFQAVERKRHLFNAESHMQKALGRILVQADTAHSFGASRNGRMAGEIADFSCFSFHAVKNLTTAEGGAVTWNNVPGVTNDEIYKQFMLLSLHGQTKDALSKTESGQWEYDIIEPYYKGNMTDVAAALGLSQLRRYSEMLNRRREIALQYNKAFSEMGYDFLKHYGSTFSSSGHLYLLRIPQFDESKRNKLIVALDNQGITSNVHYKPLPMMSAYSKQGFCMDDYPNAFNYYKNEVTLPLHSLLKDDEVEYIISSTIAQVERIKSEVNDTH